MGRVVAVVVAAGESRRMGTTGDKQLALLAGRPVLARALDAFDACEAVDGVILVCAADKLDAARDLLARESIVKVEHLVVGGRRRQHSVANGLERIEDGATVAVHDGARPLVTPALIAAAIEALPGWDGVVPATCPTDTVKQVDADGAVLSTLDRSLVRLVQTPQVFVAATLKGAIAAADADGITATDDSALVERLGARVRVIEGSMENIKITRPSDLVAAERLLAARGES